MRTLLDDSVLEPAPAGIAAALETARERAESAGRIIVDVFADNEPIDGALLDDPPAGDAGIAELRLVSADTKSFLSVTLADAAEHLGFAKERQDAASASIDAGDLPTATQAMQEVMAAWQTISQVAAHAAALLRLELAGVEFSHDGARVTGRECISLLQEHLTEVKRAHGQQDLSALSDAVGGDLAEDAERWGALLGELSRRVEAG